MIVHIECPQPVFGNIVLIQMPEDSTVIHMSVCEVEVFSGKLNIAYKYQSVSQIRLLIIMPCGDFNGI